jgi:hypothetical protein
MEWMPRASVRILNLYLCARMKYSQWIGIIAALLLIGACFLPWAYYPDLQKEFTGFFSEMNRYGKPGKVLVFFAVVQILFFLIPRVWAKRANILVAAMTIAFGIKSYILFTACYRGICPDKKAGIFLVLLIPFVMLIAAVLPDLPVKESKNA